MYEQILLIPSLNPSQKLPSFIEELHELGFWRIIVVDDGSAAKHQLVFEQLQDLKCTVVHHQKNYGKGAAIKSGLEKARKLYGDSISVITADSDGQHLPKDIERMAKKACFSPDALILGVRDFSGKDVPWRSRFGNRVMSLIFRLGSGVRCDDTQTGLRCIPSSLIDLALETEGSRYEYEMNFLQEAVKHVSMESIPIETVYEDNNSASHFKPIRDSYRIMKRFVNYAIASGLSTVLDYGLFALILALLPTTQSLGIWIATIISRSGSGAFNYALNRYWCFKQGTRSSAPKYFVLWLSQMLVSAFMVSLLSGMIPVLLAKVLTDGSLFVLSYFIQRNWVFQKEVLV